MTLVRKSFGGQIHEALDEMKEAGKIDRWDMFVSEPHGIRYSMSGPGWFLSSLTPGQTAAWLNDRGYDITFGKSA